jgi:hypothetical protein
MISIPQHSDLQRLSQSIYAVLVYFTNKRFIIIIMELRLWMGLLDSSCPLFIL